MNIRKKIIAFANQRRAIRELSALDDRTLSDIGITRSGIHSAVTGL